MQEAGRCHDNQGADGSQAAMVYLSSSHLDGLCQIAGLGGCLERLQRCGQLLLNVGARCGADLCVAAGGSRVVRNRTREQLQDQIRSASLDRNNRNSSAQRGHSPLPQSHRP